MWFSSYLFTGEKTEIRRDVESQLYTLQPRQTFLENFPAGYPQFSAFLGAHQTFSIYRRFTNLRARVLLAKQDRLSVLEKKLEALDRVENCPLFLGSLRLDRNVERQDILSEIDQALFSYDQSLSRDAQILQLKDAKRRNVSSVQNWLSGTGCIARKETQYLDHECDLLALSTPVDSTLSRLENWVEDQLIRYFSRLYRSKCKKISNDENVYISSGSLATNIARGLLGCLVIFLLLVPILVCNFLESDLLRLVIVLVATVSFIATILGITEARTVEVFVTGAAYATVLTVFITQGGPGTT